MSPVRVPSEVSLNKNTNWLNSTGVWVWYLGIILLSWLAMAPIVGGGRAWTYVHLTHGIITFYLLHWSKGSPIVEEQGKWDSYTFWEQLDDGQQGTVTRKFFTVIPVVLFSLATHGTDFRSQPLLLNLVIVVVLVVAKFPLMHKVRLFGINKY